MLNWDLFSKCGRFNLSVIVILHLPRHNFHSVVPRTVSIGRVSNSAVPPSASAILSAGTRRLKPRPNDRDMPTQHCWAQHVACVWPPCCDMLGVLAQVLPFFKFEPTSPNMSQHIATRWPYARNMLHPTMLRYVALACCDRLAGA